MRILAALILSFTPAASGFTVEIPTPKNTESWHSPDDSKSLLLKSATPAMSEISIPPLDEKQLSAGGTWRAIISVDLLGTSTAEASALLLEVLDTATGKVLDHHISEVKGQAEKAAIALDYSSAQGGDENAKLAFDADPATIWHSSWDLTKNPAPHHIGVEFGKAYKISGLHYTPRIEGYNGRAKEYSIQIRPAGKETWENVAVAPPATHPSTEAYDIVFPEPKMIDAYRMVITKDDGEGFGAVGELTPLHEKLDFSMKEKNTYTTACKQRAWLEIKRDTYTSLIGKKITLRLSNQGKAAIVISSPELAIHCSTPSSKLFGRSNGGLGPDQLGAGLLGFQALTEHAQRSLSVMHVWENSPAAQAGLQVGDVILAIDQIPLPVNDLNPGWRWFYASHESYLGRATEAALRSNKTKISLTLMREGKPVELIISLPRKQAFTTLDPATDPQAAALLQDLIASLEKSQKENGSWSDDIIRTTWASLALLATEKIEHRQAVKKAIDWSLAKYDTPEKYGNLGFWSGAYAGILYSEWYLLTKDERVIPHLTALRDWAVKGQHPCAWGVPALGHGPSGLPYEEKGLIAPAAHLLVYEALAMKCGMKSAIWELLTPYIEMTWSDPKEGGNGSMGYNRSYKDEEEFWSRSGLCSMACHLRNQRPDMCDAMTTFMKNHHPWLRNSHAYGEPGGSWGLLGLNLTKPKIFDEIFTQYAWWFSLAWQPGYGLRYTTPHMGSPYMGEDDLINATYALVFQAKKRNLYLTGKEK